MPLFVAAVDVGCSTMRSPRDMTGARHLHGLRSQEGGAVRISRSTVSFCDPWDVTVRISSITSRKRGFSILGGAAAVAVILVSVTTPGSAAAAPLAGRDHPAVQVPSDAVSSDAPSSRMARITCRLTIDKPYLSTQSPRSVNVVAMVSCTAPVKSLGISVKLYRDGRLVGESGLVQKNGSATVRGTATEGCTQDPSDRYFGIAEGKVTYPFGFSPPTWEASNRSFTSAGLDCDSSAAR